MRDTSGDADAVQLAALRRMAPADRLRQALLLSESVRTLALSRLRAAHPGRTDLELVALLLGVELVPDGAHPSR